MSSNQCVNWQGNLACLQQEGLVIKSRHTIDGIHVFGPDSDYTTLAISGLSLLSDECDIDSISVDENIDQFVLQACGYLIDENSVWSIQCSVDNACLSISRSHELDWDIEGEEMESEFHDSISKAWAEEMTAVSQGAFVSEQAYRSGASSRINFSSQQLGDIRI